MRGLIAGLIVVATGALTLEAGLLPAHAQGDRQKTLSLPKSPPMPPPRPQMSPSLPIERDLAEASACFALLKEQGALFAPVAIAPGVQPADGEDGCAVAEPVSLKGVRLPNGMVVTLDSPVTVRCALAGELARWMRDDLSAIAQRHGLVLRRLVGVGGHECRNRNRQNGGRASEHSIGNAFDVHKLEFEGGVSMSLMQDRDNARRVMREDIRSSACARFTTVLGSGSDGFHEDHLHVDLRERRGGYRLCQWDVK
jgi:hypothetical protein